MKTFFVVTAVVTVLVLSAAPKPPKDMRMTPRDAARAYGFAHCDIEQLSKRLGMSEREVAAWLIAGIKQGIKPC